jgi:hypothetical protein
MKVFFLKISEKARNGLSNFLTILITLSMVETSCLATQIFSTFHGAQIFITVFTTSHYCFLS